MNQSLSRLISLLLLPLLAACARGETGFIRNGEKSNNSNKVSEETPLAGSEKDADAEGVDVADREELSSEPRKADNPPEEKKKGEPLDQDTEAPTEPVASVPPVPPVPRATDHTCPSNGPDISDGALARLANFDLVGVYPRDGERVGTAARLVVQWPSQLGDCFALAVEPVAGAAARQWVDLRRADAGAAASAPLHVAEVIDICIIGTCYANRAKLPTSGQYRWSIFAKTFSGTGDWRWSGWRTVRITGP